MKRPAGGFTLIEIVLSLVLAGLLVSIAGPNMIGAITASSKLLQDFGTAVNLQSTMEKIISCYPDGSTMNDFITGCIPGKLSSGFTKVAAKTGYCKVVGSTFVVDNTLSSGMYSLTIKNDSTGETLTMLFSQK